MKRLLLLVLMIYSSALSSQLTAPFTESFNSSSTPTGWVNNTNDPWRFSGNMGYDASIISDHTGSAGSWFAWVDGSSSTHARTELKTDSIDVSGLTNPMLEFYLSSYNPSYVAANGSNTFSVDFYDGTTWHDTIYVHAGSFPGWRYVPIDLSSYTISGDVVVRFNVNTTTSSTAFYNDIAIDDVTVKELPACFQPTGLQATTINAFDATLKWNTVSNAINGYTVIYGTAGFNPQSAGTSANSTTDSLVITGLSAATAYHAYIFADCGATDGKSDTTGPYAFVTGCAPLTAPYYNGFENDALDAPPQCWDDYETYAGSFVEVEDFTGTAAPYAGTQALYLYSSFASSTDTLYAICPQFTDLTAGDKQIRFFANSDDVTTKLVIGTVSSPTNPSSFTAFDTVVFQAPDTYEEIIIPITTANGYNGTDEYIVFAHDMVNIFDYIRIDEFNYELIPPCPKLTSINFNGATTSSFTASFSTSGDSVDVEWGPVGFTQGTGCMATLSSTSGTVTVNNSSDPNCSILAANSSYEFYVRNNCTSSGNGFSVWSGPFSFSTSCSIGTVTLPFYENFENASGTFVGDAAGAYCTADASWDFETSDQQNGRLQFDLGYSNTSIGANDSACASLDEVSTGLPINYLIGSLDMSNYDTSSSSFIMFSFYHLDHGDEAHAPDKVWVRGSNTDSWIQIYDLEANGVTGQWVFSGDIDLSGTFRANNQNFSSTFQVRFGQQDNFNISSMSGVDGRSFDDVSLEEISCIDIPNISFSNIGGTGAILTVDNDPSAKFEYEWGPCGFTQGTGTAIADSNGTANISGLSPNSCYDLFIRRDCGVNGFSAWTGPFSFSTACNTVTLPYSENFNTDLGCFVVLDGGTTNDTWVQVPAGGNGNYNGDLDGTGHASVDSDGAGSGPIMEEDLISPFIDASNISGTLVLEFDQYYNHLASLAQVEVYDGNKWDTIIIQNSGDVGSFINPDHQTIDITQYANDSLQIKFHYDNNGAWAWWWLIDNFSVVDVVCQPPLQSTMGASFVTASTANVFWGSGGAGSETRVSWGLQGYDPTLGNLGIDSVPGTDTTYNITGLSPSTTYDFYFQDSCAGAGFSPWVGPFSFTTSCLPIFAPHTESFDNTPWVPGTGFSATGDSIDPCWSRNGTATGFNYTWRVYDQLTGSSSTGPSTDNSGSGNYLYTEASQGGSGAVATLNTPTVIVSSLNTPMLSFYIHRYGSNLGDMTVEVNDGAGWDTLFLYTTQLQSASSDPWLEQTAVLNNYGDTLQVRFRSTSKGCCAGDMAIDDVAFIEAPTCPKIPALSLNAQSVLDTSALLNWDQGANAGSYEYWIGPAGFYQGTSTAGGTKMIVSGDSAQVGGLTAQTCYEFLVRSICSPGDTSAWVGPVQFCTPCSPAIAPYFENFDALASGLGGALPNCWVATGDATFSSYSFRTNSGGTSSFGTGPLGDATTGSGIYLYTEASSGSSGDSAMLTSPLMNVTALSNPELRFSYHMYGSNIDGLKVDVYDGNSWNMNVFQMTGQQHTSNGDPWKDTAVSLSSYAANNVLQVRFRVTSLGCCSGDVAIDDVFIDDPVTCPAPSNLSISNITSSSANFSYSASSSSANSFEISYGVSLLNPANGTKVTNTGTSYSFSNLNAAANYCVYVRDICAAGDTSFWAGPICFNTLCPPSFSAPYHTDFEGISLGSQNTWENCWTTPSTSGVRWEAEDSEGTNENSFNTGPFYDATFPTTAGGIYMYLETSSSGTSAELISPGIDISSVSAPELQYSYHMYGATINRLEVYAQDNVTGTRTFLDSIMGQQQTAGSDSFRLRTINLVGLTPGAYKFVFKGYRGSSYTGDIAIDEVAIIDNACPGVANLSTGAHGCDSIELSWSSATGGSILEYGLAGFSPGTGTFTGIVTSPYSVTGLSAGNSYTFRIADTCGTDTSAFSTISDTTVSGPLPVAAFNVDSAIVNGNFVVYVNALPSQNVGTYTWIYSNKTDNGIVDTNSFTTNGPETITLVVSNGCGSDTATYTVNVNIGLEGLNAPEALKVYPNPTSDELFISFIAGTGKDVKIRVLDAQGRAVVEKLEDIAGSRYETRLSLGHLASGVYMLEIRSGDEHSKQRIVLKH